MQSLIMPYEHLCIDIETGNADPAEAESWARRYWSPNVTWKPETIGARFLEAVAKKKVELALVDAAPIIAVSIKTERDLRCLHCMRAHEPRTQYGLVEGFAKERDMLLALRNLVDSTCSDETLLIGHNLARFDLPKLRHRYIRNGLRMPAAFAFQGQPLFDTMREYSRFSLEEKPFISAADLAEALAVSSHKHLLDGASVPELYAAGRWEEVISYAMLDAVLEYDLFVRMAGMGPDEEPHVLSVAGQTSALAATSNGQPPAPAPAAAINQDF